MQGTNVLSYPVRNVTLDYFRLIFAFLVITIHIPYTNLGVLGYFVPHGLATIAVPCFFVINGYFLAPIIDDKAKVWRYIKKLLIIYVVWMAVYSPYIYLYSNHLQNKEMFIDYIVFGYYHLWYVVTLIIGTGILFLLRKANKKILFFLVVIVHLAAYIYLQYRHSTHTYSLWDKSFIYNILYLGFPFIFVGYFFCSKDIEKWCPSKKMPLAGLCVVGFILLFAEYWIKANYGAGTIFTTKLNLTLTVLVPVLFLTILAFARYKPDSGYVANLSASIYFVHILVIEFLLIGGGYTGQLFYPVVVFLGIVLSAGVIAVNRHIKIFL